MEWVSIEIDTYYSTDRYSDTLRSLLTMSGEAVETVKLSLL